MNIQELSQEELDEAVINHACELAAGINNAGREEQIAFLEHGAITIELDNFDSGECFHP
jgi:hypothetical protein